MEQTIIIDEILFSLAKNQNITTKEAFHKIKNEVLAKYQVSEGPSHIRMIERYEELLTLSEIPDEIRIRKVLRKRAVRSLSGVSVISLLTKFWGCPGKCIYCPTYEGLPKSYISDEPAVQRAEMNAFDPFRQVQNRLQSLRMTGNAISKCDVRIIGGTWSVYPVAYQEDFIKQIYDAHTAFEYTIRTKSENGGENNPFLSASIDSHPDWIPSQTLEEAKKRNETAKSRVIGMAIETRPDWITPEEIIRLRQYGVTRVEIGYQTTHDYINELNKRGHGNKESIEATRLLKDAGFKVVAHMMPGLVGATPELDRLAMNEVFANSLYRPDELKIYPMVVTPNSELTELWERGEFVPYEDDILIPLMAELQGMIPEYVRLNRMYRDIPAHEILAGSKLANLRQVTEIAMRARGITRHDISAREIRARANNPQDAILDVIFYEASDGHEYFIQMIDPVDRTLFGVCRMRIPSQIFTGESHFIPELDNSALIRELHVFGDQIPVGVSGFSSHIGDDLVPMAGQHMGFGKKMLQKCEDICNEKYKSVKKIAVISGIGAREYYRNRGYELKNEYMIKNIDRT
ncbi:tRNA uridine(34) 5-carboxymethylaminomethyl modification radical SAM/GNAT enzyme Elp3 [Candidatus Gracilibacteria bacterium]|nr:tRNA uridine(34) 5-carboxymethylaminomethyl modification radical SAM/GNAT enzyme Elp3 [Candidatus Gracilibacteria bacterium]